MSTIEKTYVLKENKIEQIPYWFFKKDFWSYK